jgi:hypothetical protein
VIDGEKSVFVEGVSEGQGNYREEEAEEIRKRLQGMGYIE